MVLLQQITQLLQLLLSVLVLPHIQIHQSGYSGSGSATFNVTKTGTTYTVAITAAGSGFSASETITIVGTQLNGATTANDATITITTVDGSGGITEPPYRYGLAEGPVTGVSVAGTGAAFGTITKGRLIAIV